METVTIKKLYILIMENQMDHGIEAVTTCIFRMNTEHAS